MENVGSIIKQKKAMELYKTYLMGVFVVMSVTFTVTIIFKKRPEQVDTVIDRILFPVMALLFFYACFTTDWSIVKKRLSKDIGEYRETQQNLWKSK